MSKSVVLWNSREAKEHCEAFAKSYAQLRSDLLDHLDHKGHVALGYADDWDGFFIYCREKLKLELAPKTIRLQIDAAQVSREVGVDVPMVIGRHLAKLPPEKQKEIYDEVITAREVAGQRSANQMEPDVRKVVRREMGVIEPAVSVVTDEPLIDVGQALMNDLGPDAKVYTIPGPEFTKIHNAAVDAHYRAMGISTPAEQMDALNVPAQEPRTDAPEAREVNQPHKFRNDEETPDSIFGMPKAEPASSPYAAAKVLLNRFISAYSSADQEAMLCVFFAVKKFLDVQVIE